MTQSQLASSSLSNAPNAHPPQKLKKQTKAQEIAALKEELRVTQELLMLDVSEFILISFCNPDTVFLETSHHT